MSTFDRLLPELNHPDSSVRRQAVRGLAEARDPASLPILVRMLADDDWRVRKLAMTGLIDLPGEAAVRGMYWALRRGAERERALAAEALGWIGDRRAVPHLSQALLDLCGPVVQQAAFALLRLAERDPSPAYRAAIPYLRPTLFFQLTSPGETRFYRHCADRIEALTAHVKDLPLPSDGASLLPIPAGSAPQPAPAESPLAALWEWWRKRLCPR